MVILAFSFADRLALGIVLQDIKTDLDLSDTQLGFLTGIAFALFYAIMGVPIARWADRGDRVKIISLAIAVWSAGVALCSFATSFLQLLLIRIGVAVGEAGCLPPSHSLIADFFTRAERPRAVSRFMLGGPLALTIGLFAAGWLNEFYGWRATFAIIGLPGLALATLAALTLKEPRRAKTAGTLSIASGLQTHPQSSFEPSFKDACARLWANGAYRHLVLCYSVWAFFGWGILQWQPAFFIRSHGLQTGELGTWFALVHGLAAGAGVYLGGELAGRYAANNERLQLLACAVAFVFFAVVNACAYLVSDHYVAFGALMLAAIGGNTAQGPILATIQTLVAPRMRAISIAVVFFFSNLIGAGLGPLAAGALSDALQPSMGQESLRYALVILCPGYFWASWHLLRASRSVAHDLKAAQIADSDPATSANPWATAK